MRTYKVILPIVAMMHTLLLFNSFGYSQSKDTDKKISVGVEIVSRGWTDYYAQKEEGYFIRASLSNTQDSTISFVIMSCSWPTDNWATNNKSVYITHRGCDANSPVRITLKPKQSISFYGFISDTGHKLEGQKFKLAFLYYNSFNDLTGFTAGKKNAPDEFWSNEVVLQDNVFRYEVMGK